MPGVVAVATVVVVSKMSQRLLQQILGLLFLVVVAVVVFLLPVILSKFKPSTESDSVEVTRGELMEAVRAGDFKRATEKYLSIQNNPNASADEKALAVLNTLGMQYRLTGDPGTRLTDIQNMKKIILDESVSLRTRADTLDSLASQYYFSGRDPAVFTEIYKDEPFSSYLVPGDPDLSARHLAEWSYDMVPTSNSAITIARWYAEQNVLNPGQPENTTKMYADLAGEYLDKATAASRDEAARDPLYVDDTRYLAYRYWHAIIVGQLAGQKGEPYKSQYREVYEDFIQFAQTQKNILARGYLLYAYLFFAQRVAQYGDELGAKTYLDKLVRELRDIESPRTSVFVQQLKNEYRYRPTGATWRVVENMFTLSPNLKEEVKRLITEGQ